MQSSAGLRLLLVFTLEEKVLAEGMWWLYIAGGLLKSFLRCCSNVVDVTQAEKLQFACRGFAHLQCRFLSEYIDLKPFWLA